MIVKLKTLNEIVSNAEIDMDEKSKESSYDTMKEVAFNWLVEIIIHNEFLSQPLTLSQFVPCKDGVPIEKPVSLALWNESTNSWIIADEEYKAAEDNVVFEGFEINAGDNPDYSYWISKDFAMSGFYAYDTPITPSIHLWKVIPGGYELISKQLKTISDFARLTQVNSITLR